MRYLAEMAFRYDEDGALVKKTPIYKEVPADRFEEMVHSAFVPWIYGVKTAAQEEREPAKKEKRK